MWWIVLLITLVVLTIVAFSRWFRTPVRDPEFAPRRDTALLLVVTFGGVALAHQRSTYLLGTHSFYAYTLALLPFAVAAIFLVARLVRIYREQHS